MDLDLDRDVLLDPLAFDNDLLADTFRFLVPDFCFDLLLVDFFAFLGVFDRLTFDFCLD